MTEQFKCAVCTPEFCQCENIGWISVKDKLPLEDTIILAWDGQEMWFCKKDSISSLWREVHHTCGCCGEDPEPTHWMYLPEPPTK